MGLILVGRSFTLGSLSFSTFYSLFAIHYSLR